MTRAELIAALEAATGPSRELDAQIGEFLRWMPDDAPGWLVNWAGPIKADGDKLIAMHSDGKRGANWYPPRFTSSIDAAVSLVPEGYSWMCQSGAYAQVWQGGAPHFEGNGTPAIALCIAALKAGEGKDG